MKKRLTNGLILVFTLSIMASCNTNPIAKIQGVYEVNKDSLKSTLQKEMDSEDSLSIELFNIALKNAMIEIEIKGDSINGIIYLEWETTLIESSIIERNDSLVINTGKSEAYLIPTETGLLYRVSGSDKSIILFLLYEVQSYKKM